MATIYSYPRVENLTGDDVLLLSDSTEEQRTLSVSIGQVTDYVSGFIQLGNNPSAINFVSELQDYITIENNTLTISGYATDSSVNTVANSVVQLGITTTANLNAATAALNTSLTADYTSYVGTQLTSYSTSAITTQEIATATADLASASSVTELETQFVFTNGSITGTSGALSTEIAAASAGTSQAFATRVTNLEAMFTLNNADPQAPIGLSSANIQAIQTVIAGEGYAFSSTVDTLTNSVNSNTANVSQNATDITTLDSSVTTINTAITGIEGDVVSNTTNITANASDISNLTNSLATANVDITQNATDVTSLTADVTTNTANITSNDADIVTANSNIATNASAITTLTNDLAAANTAITQNATNATNLSSTVTTNTSDIATANSNITTANTNIATNASDITTLTNNLATTNTNVTQNATDVTSLTTDVTTNETAITANGAAITTANTNIATNASAITTLTNDLTTANADITQNATNHTSLTSTVSTNTTNINNNASDIATANTNISTNASSISTLTNDLNTAEADITTNSGDITSLTTSVNANTGTTSANATDISTLNAGLTTANNNISANSSDITSVTTTANANTGNITANANTISSLTASVNGNAASITTNASAIADVDGNVSGSYGVTVDGNGSIAGLQLLTDGTTSGIEFAANQFKFTNGAGTLTPFSIDAVNSKINLTGDVVFTSSSIPAFDQDVQGYIDTVGEIFTSATTISGGQITTGVIKNSTFSGNSNWNTFSTSGTGINLDLGAINAEKFFIAPDGTSSFTGSHAGGTLGGWEISPSRIYKESAQGAIGLNSSRSALEIYDTNDAIVVDVNNNSSLSNITGTTISGTNSITGTTFKTFTNTNVPITSQNPTILESQSQIPAFSSGQIDFAASAVNGETVRVTADLTSKTLISTTVSYSGQWSVRLKATLTMNVYNPSSNYAIASMQRSYDETKLYTSGNTPSLTITDTFSAPFTSNINSYYVKFTVTNASAEFIGQPAQTDADFSGTFSTPSVSSSNVTLVADANKTEIAPGGFQVVKSASQYFRADRNGSSWLDSSGVWYHNGSIVQSSDINQKYNIKPIDFNLDLLDTINGYTYSQLLNPVNELENLKSEDIHTTESAGLMAQEIEKILPSAVTTTENGTKALDYSATVGLLLSIVKKLNNKIDTLSAEVESLKQ